MFMYGINTVVSFHVVMFFFNYYLTQNFMQVDVHPHVQYGLDNEKLI